MEMAAMRKQEAGSEKYSATPGCRACWERSAVAEELHSLLLEARSTQRL
jgi:hypothetical protein